MAVVRLSEPVQSDNKSEVFAIDEASAALFNEHVEPVPLADVLASPDRFLQANMRLDLKVKQVCQKKGCFFIGQQGGESLRVTFQDYAFFVPSDIAGREVMLVGKLLSKDVSPQQAKHLSKDLQQKGAIVSGKQYEFVASAVRVLSARGDE
jgi:hypothetical protein